MYIQKQTQPISTAQTAAGAESRLAFFHTHLLSAGYTLHDTDTYGYYVYKTNGNNSDRPDVYVNVQAVNSTSDPIVRAELSDSSGTTQPYHVSLVFHGRWDASTHSGDFTCDKVVELPIVWPYAVFISKDFIFAVAQQENAYGFNSHMRGASYCLDLPYNPKAVLASGISPGSAVTVDVDSTDGFLTGSRYYLFDSSTGAYCEATISSIISGTQLVLDSVTGSFTSGAVLALFLFDFFGVYPYSSINAPGEIIHYPNASKPSDVDIYSYLYGEITTNPMGIFQSRVVGYISILCQWELDYYPDIYLDNHLKEPDAMIPIGSMQCDDIKDVPIFGVSGADAQDEFLCLHNSPREMGLWESGGSKASNTVTIKGKSWTINQWADHILCVISGTGRFQFRSIQSNTADTITVKDDFYKSLAGDSVIEIFKKVVWSAGIDSGDELGFGIQCHNGPDEAIQWS